MPTRNSEPRTTEDGLRTLERLVSEGDLDFAKVAMGLHGPDFDAMMDETGRRKG